MWEYLIIVAMERVSASESFVDHEEVVAWVVSRYSLLLYHLEWLHFSYQFVSDPLHELFDVVFKESE